MLRELFIENFTIIDRLRLSFAPGLTALTGETGAGKSILIDALEFLLGGQGDATLVRAGTDAAHLEAIFCVEDDSATAQGLRARLQERGIPWEEGTLIVRRELESAGRSGARLNGRAVPLSLLRQIGEELVDIHGQSDHLSLLQTNRHLDYLDRFAGLWSARQSLHEKVNRLQHLRRRLQRQRQHQEELRRREELLRFQAQEIAAAQLVPGEEERLRTEARRLRYAREIAATIESALALLGKGEGERALTEGLAELIQHLRALGRYDPEWAQAPGELEEWVFRLQELRRRLRLDQDRAEDDPARLEALEERLAHLEGLKRKYGTTIEGIIALHHEIGHALQSLETGESEVLALEQQEAALLAEIGATAEELSRHRHAAAGMLETLVAQELASLSLKEARFHPEITRVEEPHGVAVALDSATPNTYAFDHTGIDRVEFALSANPGEPLRPLTKVASGGEMTRFLLALKAVLSHADPVPILVFDEVEAGVGGRSGRIIGETLSRLSLSHQVICVTHLPQVAAFAQTHLKVTKETEGARPLVGVAPLHGQERLAELAVMLGSTSPAARQNAAELLQQAEAWRKRQRHQGPGDTPATPADGLPLAMGDQRSGP